MSENYIVINGKKTELTDEQLKELGIEVKKDQFARKYGAGTYHWIAGDGAVMTNIDFGDKDGVEGKRFNIANYCADKKLMEQRALHETLNRLLWRASVRAGELENEWNYDNAHWFIIYDCRNSRFIAQWNAEWKQDFVYFPSAKTAENAIETIVKPFMKEHPEFVW